MNLSGRVAIVDDRALNRERYAEFVQDIGFNPVLYDQRITSLDNLEKEFLKEDIHFSICDHRLSEGNYANFTGAQAVSRFYQSKITPILMTGYVNSDADTTIRPYRRNIPVLLHNKDVTPQKIKDSFEIAFQEVINDNILPERQPCRSIMTVTDIIQNGDFKIIKVVLTQWDPLLKVGFPFSMLPPEIQEAIKLDMMLIADVNVDAEESEDLYFENFKMPNKDVLESI